MDESYTPGQSRTRPLEVLALGLPRTGTRSLADALEILGFKHTAHGFDLMDNPPYAARWTQAVDAKYFHKGTPFSLNDWDELLGHCSAVTDLPCAAFWRELAAAYPDAKVVLVQRDEDKWFKSFSEGIIDAQFTSSAKFIRDYIEPLIGSFVGPLCFKLCQGWLEATTPEGMKAHARSAYRRHYKDVKSVIGKERLLEYQLGSGWQPLCDFLGCKVPDAAFPWINEANALDAKVQEFQRLKTAEMKALFKRRVLPVIACLVVAALAWRLT